MTLITNLISHSIKAAKSDIIDSNYLNANGLLENQRILIQFNHDNYTSQVTSKWGKKNVWWYDSVTDQWLVAWSNHHYSNHLPRHQSGQTQKPIHNPSQLLWVQNTVMALATVTWLWRRHTRRLHRRCYGDILKWRIECWNAEASN